MLRMLEQDPNKIPCPDRQDLIDMAMNCIRNLESSFDASAAFKRLFLNNKLDGSEDWKINDKIRGLVYEDLAKFRENLLKTSPPKNVQELFNSLTPPKGVKRKTNQVEGGELYDHDDDGPELDISELDKEFEFDKDQSKMVNDFVLSQPSSAFETLDDQNSGEKEQEIPSKIRQQFWPLTGQ